MMIAAIRHDLETRWGDTDGSRVHLEIAHTQNGEAAMALKEELALLFPGADIHVDPLSLRIEARHDKMEMEFYPLCGDARAAFDLYSGAHAAPAPGAGAVYVRFFQEEPDRGEHD